MIRFCLKNIAIASAIAFSALNATAEGNVNAFGVDPKISDLALIYAGSPRRPVWTKEELTPYVTHK